MAQLKENYNTGHGLGRQQMSEVSTGDVSSSKKQVKTTPQGRCSKEGELKQECPDVHRSWETEFWSAQDTYSRRNAGC